jgi:DNA-binding response OmpR family regulator
MRGTVLLLAGRDSSGVYAEPLRANGLLVYEVERREDANWIVPDVVVTLLSENSSPSVIRELRNWVDHATSIIVVSRAAGEADRDAAHRAGADSVMRMPVLPGDLLYEVQRALILRRSGRRLPQNREQV